VACQSHFGVNPVTLSGLGIEYTLEMARAFQVQRQHWPLAGLEKHGLASAANPSDKRLKQSLVDACRKAIRDDALSDLAPLFATLGKQFSPERVSALLLNCLRSVAYLTSCATRSRNSDTDVIALRYSKPLVTFARLYRKHRQKNLQRSASSAQQTSMQSAKGSSFRPWCPEYAATNRTRSFAIWSPFVHQSGFLCDHSRSTKMALGWPGRHSCIQRSAST
jgi:hypothetical protein